MVFMIKRNFQAGVGTAAYTTSTGGGSAHNNMQPYAGVKWVIKT